MSKLLVRMLIGHCVCTVDLHNKSLMLTYLISALSDVVLQVRFVVLNVRTCYFCKGQIEI